MDAARPYSVSTFFLDLFGAYLACVILLSKSFTYLFVRVGPIPLFITEALMISLAMGWIVMCCRQRRLLIPKDPLVLVPLAILWLLTFHGLAPSFEALSGNTINSLKRSALGYYTGFAFLTFALLSDRPAVNRLLLWMFVGAASSSILSFLTDHTGLLAHARSLVISGVSAMNGLAFCALYALFNGNTRRGSWFFSLFGGFVVAQIFFLSRSAVLALGVVFSAAGILLLLQRKLVRPTFLAKYAFFSLAFGALFLSFFGAPSSVDRFGFLSVFKDLFKKEPVVTIVTPPAPAAPPPAAAAPESEEKPPAVPVRSLPKEVAIKPTEVKNQYPEFERPSFLSRFEKAVLTKRNGGNVYWRLQVWTEGIQQVLYFHPWLGMGFSRPLVIKSLSPYKDSERFVAAMNKLYMAYDFPTRLSNQSRRPEDPVDSSIPLEMNEQEIEHFNSLYWYGIDFHNSHVAFFYRFGAVGFLAYAVLLGAVFIRLLKAALRIDPVAAFGVVFILWYMAFASFNVVLEGPFGGVLFWVFIGCMLRHSFRTPAKFEKGVEFL